MLPFITIFTPTYNRAQTLPQLYESLCRQSDKDFIWLIVDDGSSDNTSELIAQWAKEGKIKVSYTRQQNSGKMRAHNHGARLAQSELFLCVDSDDFLADNAIADIHSAWEKRERNVCGIIAHKCIVDKAKNTRTARTFPIKGPTSQFDLYSTGYKGDLTLVFRTDILRQYPFPEIEDEKFITEATAYDLIDLNHKYMLLDKALTICEYRPDGYTANAAKTELQYPKGWALYHNQRAHYFSPTLKHKLRNTMFYIMYSRMAHVQDIYTKSSTKGLLYVLSWILCMAKEKAYINNLKKSCR